MATSIGAVTLDLTLNQDKYNKALKQTEKTGSAFAGKMAKLFAAAFSVAAVTKFASACIDLASDLNEVQNVVDVTFGTMSDKVNDFASGAASAFGLSETMAKKYAGTLGSMAEAFGFSEESAYNMATQLTGLAGDVASFYNISQDEAFNKLKSVFTGETEALKSLGVVMTQSALDAFALANGYGKTTAKMSEAEKVALRYAFVQNQLTNAAGDFSRTSGGWANQVRILKLQFDSLKASIGQGLINALTPVLQMLNELLGYLTKAAAKFKDLTASIFGWQETTSSGGGATLEIAAENAESVATSLETASKFMAGFDEMQTVSGGTGESTGAGSSSVPSIAAAVDASAMETAGESVSKFGGIIDIVKTKVEQFKNGAINVFETVKGSLVGLGELAKTIWEKFYNDVCLPAFNYFGAVFVDTFATIESAWEANGATVFESIESALFETKEAFIEVWDNVLKPIFDKLLEVMTALWNDHIQPLLNNTIETAWEVVNATANAIAWLGVCIRDFVTYFDDEIKKVVGVVNWLVERAGVGIGVVIDIFSGLLDFVSNIFQGKWSAAFAQVRAVFGSVGSFINGVWLSIKSALSGIPAWFKSQFDGAVFMIKSAFGGIANWFKNIFATAWQNVKNVFSKGGAVFKDIKDGILDSLKGIINGLIGGINKVIAVPFNGLNDALNKLRGINILGAKPFAGIANISVPQIPKLAQGGYVEANTPRLAIIGDNKREGEIVSPESKLQAMANAAAGANNETLAAIKSELNAIKALLAAGGDVVIQVGDEQIARASARGAASLQRRYNTTEINAI